MAWELKTDWPDLQHGCCFDFAIVDDEGERLAEVRGEECATLIVAAPDMLAALKECRETLRQICEGQHPDNVCCHHLGAVDAAIAKAERAK